VEFKTKPQIALEQLRWAHQAGLPRGVALLDAGYGNNTALLGGITAVGMPYAAGIARPQRCGHPALRRCRRRSGRPGTGCAATASIGRSPALALRQPKSVWQAISCERPRCQGCRAVSPRCSARPTPAPFWAPISRMITSFINHELCLSIRKLFQPNRSRRLGASALGQAEKWWPRF
jgi:hypothetical protein